MHTRSQTDRSDGSVSVEASSLPTATAVILSLEVSTVSVDNQPKDRLVNLCTETLKVLIST